MQIQPNERDKIAVWFSQGLSIREIGRRLDRDVSVISRELRRNRFDDGYVAIHAQRVSSRRKNRSSRRCSQKDSWIYSYVFEKIKDGWSPEQISGRLELERGKPIVHWETIYRWIYNDDHQERKYWEYLSLKRKKREKKYGRKTQRVRIPNRVSIHLRDKRIEKRKQFGHWEGDSLIGRQTKSKVIHTEVERKTRYLRAVIINSKSANDTIKAQKQIFSELPAGTVTTDNGTEFVDHQQLQRLGIKTYFADPYSSWQRGTNENTNGLLRRYLPKKMSFENLDQSELDDIVFEINNRPKKVLKFFTPQEVLQKELLVTGVAFEMRM